MFIGIVRDFRIESSFLMQNRKNPEKKRVLLPATAFPVPLLSPKNHSEISLMVLSLLSCDSIVILFLTHRKNSIKSKASVLLNPALLQSRKINVDLLKKNVHSKCWTYFWIHKVSYQFAEKIFAVKLRYFRFDSICFRFNEWHIRIR